jgi:plastocyanin
MHKPFLKLIVLGMSVIILAAAAKPAAAAETIRIETKSIAFTPAKVSAHVGDTVEWTNDDFVAHTATASNGDWNIALPVHGKGSTVLKKAGKITYICKFHPNMTGEIDVR